MDYFAIPHGIFTCVHHHLFLGLCTYPLQHACCDLVFFVLLSNKKHLFSCKVADCSFCVNLKKKCCHINCVNLKKKCCHINVCKCNPICTNQLIHPLLIEPSPATPIYSSPATPTCSSHATPIYFSHATPIYSHATPISLLVFNIGVPSATRETSVASRYYYGTPTLIWMMQRTCAN